MPSADRLIIFDTTLRDGEQSPGASMNLAEKLEVAHALKDLGVDIIEAGFPIASPGDFEAVQTIARDVHGPAIAGLARCNIADIDRAWEALRDSERPRIHVFLATSAIHRQYKLRMSTEEIVSRAVEGVKRAKGYCDDVEFSPEDAARTELDFLAEVVEKAIEAGATTVNIPDTVGYAVPEQYAACIRHLKQHVRGIDDVVISVHCHDDLGLAVANSLAALASGARQVECTINGIGERAGNCSLEEVVMAMKTRADHYHCTTGINTPRLVPTSRLVSSITGVHVQRNKAIVGRNAFAHEAGIHQDGMLKERRTYEIMQPEDVGFQRTDLVLGKHSGRAALADRAKALGYTLTGEQLHVVFDEFKKLADKKKDIFDGDIIALIEQRIHGEPAEGEWKLVAFEVASGSGHKPRAKLTLRRDEKEFTEEVADGDGPIDAAFLATEKITGIKLRCIDYHVRSATLGHDALGEVNLSVQHGNQTFRGRGVSTDTVEATVQAILSAVNRIAMTAGNRGSGVGGRESGGGARGS
jgi:2-isopropylmalate synthase